MSLYIAVVGPGEDATDADLVHAYDVGERIAARGGIVLTGGLGGVMAAAARGAREASGVSIGILPGTERAQGNEHLTYALPTGLGELRNGLLLRCADAAICIGGSWGTLSELALARRTGLPVVALGGWQVLDAGGAPLPVLRAGTPADAVEQAWAGSAR